MRPFAVSDSFLPMVDQSLCSQACPCKFTNSNAQNNYRGFYPSIYNTWTIDQTKGVGGMQQCPETVQYNTYNNAQRNFQIRNPGSANSSFNLPEYENYWNRIENKFNCTGYCNTTYITGNGQSYMIVKYLFSDVNR